MAFCTYLYKDPKNGIPIYVGEGTLERPFHHLKRNPKSHADYLLRKRMRDGFNPQPIIIPAPSKADAQEMEALLIEMIGRRDLGTGPLLNLRPGGISREWTPAQCEAQRQRQIEKYKSQEAREAHGAAIRRSHQEMHPDVRAARDEKLSVALTRSHANRTAEQKAITSQRQSIARKEVESKRTVEEKAQTYEKMAQKIRKPCTVDGVKIYPSLRALCDELGHGSKGGRSPTFRYV